MIELNLIPDVKRELLRTQRARSTVISGAILTSIVAIGVVVLLVVWVTVVQGARGVLSDNTIATESKKIAKVSDLTNTLTIQNQLNLLDKMHANKTVSSRVFDVFTTINPPAPNDINISKLNVDVAHKTITVDAQAPNGYPALEVFKKTISATTFQYKDGDSPKSAQLASNIIDSDRSYGEDSTGKKVLRFTISFTYPLVLFQTQFTGAKIVAPTKTNVTDSFLSVPQSLFSEKAEDSGVTK